MVSRETMRLFPWATHRRRNRIDAIPCAPEKMADMAGHGGIMLGNCYN